jgi:ribosome-binding factor A
MEGPVARYRRTDRLNELLRQEISILLRSSVRDPSAQAATITAVDTSPELDHAKVYVTTLSEDDREEAVAGLRRAASYLRRELGGRLHMRRVPELHFMVDRQLDEAVRIERLLRDMDIQPEEPDTDESDADDRDGRGE